MCLSPTFVEKALFFCLSWSYNGTSRIRCYRSQTKTPPHCVVRAV
nr:MAG TPA: hypothetical protein [Caudoviricetes sp.]